eukprot:5678860-Ditylum_brightwellii.AAC.1
MPWIGGKTLCLLARSEILCLLARLETLSPPLLPVKRRCAEHMNQRFRTQHLANFSRITNVPPFPFHSHLRRAHSFETSSEQTSHSFMHNKTHTVPSRHRQTKFYFPPSHPLYTLFADLMSLYYPHSILLQLTKINSCKFVCPSPSVVVQPPNSTLIAWEAEVSTSLALD